MYLPSSSFSTSFDIAVLTESEASGVSTPAHIPFRNRMNGMIFQTLQKYIYFKYK